jgi:UDP-N-acetylmuramyl pentapeptide phosphotransferase/UDP-N-acetylglucosamine-1-phosphate transferase
MPFLIALAAGIVLTPLLGRVGSALGLVDRPDTDGLKIHEVAVPLTGGWAVVLTGLGTAVVWEGALWPGLLAAVLLSLAIGTIDDLISLSPLVRVAGLIVAGVILAAGGIDVAPLAPLAAPAMVVLVVASANAVNLLDGQDGLAGGLAAIASLGLAMIMPGGGAATAAFATAGALVGFVFWNRPPARIFLGNGGSYAVGTLLAAFAAVAASRGWSGLLAAAICLTPFGFELGFTVFRRLLTRRSLSSGDRLHGYDLLSARLGRSRTTGLLWVAGVVFAALGAMVAEASPIVAGTVAAGITCLAVVTGTWLWTSRGPQAEVIQERPTPSTAPPSVPHHPYRTEQEGST